MKKPDFRQKLEFIYLAFYDISVKMNMNLQVESIYNA